ncbi:TIGR04283 family arsenosugar biosynthesis glycosyltransferase [Gemella sp. GH3]|uniref:TIGR04283 family arsenosugar biosynthesis glycosyltransferase n=1 Tax=unclassified Gemella TaxID=2624949 RepID=UPI0015CFA453|nr:MULTISPECIES: TIGR04283 family arsenosugar biosynthesis glycosyltransferase [unclassified Gemella]MBF0714445.1 TIGR04283 family arsenosugar biosynthesis glycosyltransferase [Gemella sp. GH3.1]NYS51397.1 TIGR04283 family arsenosugar biosynthesis glycosyltransferase [Gemella sp. GH3]
MISIIIPIYNEEKILHDFIYNLYCLEHIKDCEVIFVDANSSDKTIEILKDLSYFNYKYYTSAKKGRANQMNYGAKLSKGNIIWFLHADSVLEKNAITKILNSNYDVGCFKINFHPGGFKMFVNKKISTYRVKKKNIAFGDQGIFIKKYIFEKINGFKDIPIMEDYRLSEDLTNAGYKIKVIDSRITTSSRRYKKHPLKTMWQMKKFQRMYKKGVDINKIAKLYKDIR